MRWDRQWWETLTPEEQEELKSLELGFYRVSWIASRIGGFFCPHCSDWVSLAHESGNLCKTCKQRRLALTAKADAAVKEA